eukprot:CAMPEP_0119365842 /NCGR_PEP_ID=MMETSP1334-20130426/12749_1 /TAXON_ID=127549 /ORGANISM="Calcidiscus leptoporus, Strain RCC1130" /LENGTH=88 /DNA_ID=CAMNT_0007381909 /DNA_START=250 /DNA_END=513 /DNA_ORIENTATION=-
MLLYGALWAARYDSGVSTSTYPQRRPLGGSGAFVLRVPAPSTCPAVSQTTATGGACAANTALAVGPPSARNQCREVAFRVPAPSTCPA